PDGVTWLDALRIARASGKVSFPASGGPREMLAADRTYYVRSDGSDANSGAANSAGSAFLTIQKAVETICALDLSIFQATIQLADGAYGGTITLKPYLGALPPIIKGNAATPANVAISTASSAVSNAGGGVWRVQDVKITTSAGNALSATGGGTIRFQNIEFGAVAGYHIFAGPSSNVVALGGYAVSDGAQYHIAANGYVSLAGMTVSYSGAPAFSGANILAGRGGVVDCFGMSFVNAAAVTGSRYAALHNGVIFSNGGGASYLPGSSAGSTASGGVFA
ncbi:MAG: hypothetical protein JWR89_2716, partial [Tardiphaga sp.]|nr:hypothetical protein [Tardiphaga sp.]